MGEEEKDKSLLNLCSKKKQFYFPFLNQNLHFFKYIMIVRHCSDSRIISSIATGDGAVLTLHTIAFSLHSDNPYTHIHKAAFCTVHSVYFCLYMNLQGSECQAAWFSKFCSKPCQSRRWAHNCQSLWKRGGKRQESTHKPANAGCIILYGGGPQHVYTHSVRQLWASWACRCLCFS